MHNKILPCIVCGKVCESAIPPLPGGALQYMNHPYGGTAFTTTGHYGSTVFDPMSESAFLEITICDDCLTKNQEKIIEGRRVPGSRPPIYSQWMAPA